MQHNEEGNWSPVEFLLEDQERTKEIKEQQLLRMYGMQVKTIDQPPAGGAVLPLPSVDSVSTPLAVYSRAYELIKSGWIKGHEAVTAQGQSCAPESEEAVKWCVIGSWKAAIHYEPDLVPHDYMYKYMNTLWNTANLNHMINLEHPDPPQLNDKHNTEHTLILRCYEKVMAHLMKHPESNMWHPKGKKATK